MPRITRSASVLHTKIFSLCTTSIGPAQTFRLSLTRTVRDKKLGRQTAFHENAIFTHLRHQVIKLLNCIEFSTRHVAAKDNIPHLPKLFFFLFFLFFCSSLEPSPVGAAAGLPKPTKILCLSLLVQDKALGAWEQPWQPQRLYAHDQQKHA